MTDGSTAVPPARGGAAGSSGAIGDPSSTIAGLWAETLQALAAHIAHDLRNTLNGVAVNLEVVRGRSARGADPASIAPFATTAASQFEVASAAAEALLGFARPEAGDPDVAAIVARLATLARLRRTDALVAADGTSGNARSSVPADVVRTVVARSVLSGLVTSDPIACETTVGGDIFLRVTGGSHAPSLDPDLVAVASAHGVRFASEGNVLEIRFPRAGARAIPSAPA